MTSWDKILEHCTTGFQSAPSQPSVASTQAAIMEDNLQQESWTHGELFTDDFGANKDEVAVAQCKTVWQLSEAEVDSLVTAYIDGENNLSVEETVNYPSLVRQQSLDLFNIDEEGLKKYDSFSRWMSKELGEVEDSHTKTSSAVYWGTIDDESIIEDSTTSNKEHMDSYLMNPTLSQEQLFSIIDFSPNWAYTNLETKVLITGTFLNNKDIAKYKWSCMFGEIEVSAEILADGTLRCHAPPHKAGKVPFYITCSNRLACSEVREFEYTENHGHYIGASDSHVTSTNEMNLHIRLEKLLSLGSFCQTDSFSSSINGIPDLSSKINSLIMKVDDEWFNMLKLFHDTGFSPDTATDRLLEKLLMEKLHTWLLHKVAEDGKGPNVLDKEGQGVIHLASALGYDWAIKPTITAGVNVNFRDSRGWTALHWAAFCGRERTVVALINLGAASGALTDPTPMFPSGRTPADLASLNGHKGIAGFLAESSLTSHLSTLTLKDTRHSELNDVSNAKGIEDIAESSALQLEGEDVQAGLSLKDSLSAVRNAAQAAARIYQVFRVHSFHRKKRVEYGDDKCGMSGERAFHYSLLSRPNRNKNDMPMHAAAIRIQNKFRGWKGRKEFLIIRQHIVKIQAHVRGHQVRKHQNILWSVGIVEKAILRWRRKGSGLRGFRSERLLEGHTKQNQHCEEDDYDFLHEGRKQTEARLEKALTRVKSMVQYPEARDQYRRLLTVVRELQESTAMQATTPSESEEAAEGDLMIELDELVEDDMDIFTPIAW